MAESSEQSGWREYIATTANLFGVGGGVVTIASFLFWLFGGFAGPFFIAAISVGATLFTVWLMGHVFVRSRDPLLSLGALREGQKLIESANPQIAALTIAEKPEPRPKLDFVIDTGQESHVNVQRGGGRANATRVIADIRLRCEKETDSPSPMDDAPHGATRSLTIEQRLSPGEAKRIENHRYANHANFEFDDLVLNIAGGKRSPDIKSKKFRIPKNTFAYAFPLSLLDRAKRIKALSEVLGTCVQLHEPLRISSKESLEDAVLETWRTHTMDTLERAYTETGAKHVFKEMSYGRPIPSEATAQGDWLRGCIVVLGDLVTKETGEYVQLLKSNTNNP